MWEDPIVKEVRQTRLEIEQECDGNFRKIYNRALDIQKEIAEKRVLSNAKKGEGNRKSRRVLERR
ncbi:hypothetical protein BH20ACI1_BH20ACI1_30450 [soil metagenome]